MRYRGFNIVSTYADHISKYDSSNRVWGQAPGYTDAVRSAYKPHRDTGNSEEQREVLQKKIASLEKEFGKSISLSFTEMKRQIDAVISLAVECLMLCATVECEQLEQLEQLEQGLALGLE